MIVLGILRHAKSSWDDPGVRDFDRPLNARGRTAAERMGRELKQRGVRFDHVLASPAVRVRETLDRFSESYGVLPPVHFEDKLYAASESTLLRVIQGLPRNVRAPLIVGHNPGLHDLVAALTGTQIEKFPTAALALIALRGARWHDAVAGSGCLRALTLPRALD